jgi:hypothetical protein
LTAGEKRAKDRRRLAYIRATGEVDRIDIIWECQIKEMLKKDKEMKKKFEEYRDEGPLDIRSMFYGGRTGPKKLFHKAAPGEKISYLDVTSLYP